MSDKNKFVEASHVMKGPGHSFLACIVDNNLDSCVFHFKKESKTAYEKDLVANTLYSIDPENAYLLHKEAHEMKPKELVFLRDYAMELHRKGEFEKATRLYETFLKINPDRFRVKVWLSDCYINTGEIDKAIQKWLEIDHANRRIDIESALHEIYGKTDLYQRRNYYRSEIIKGNAALFYDLFFLDLNWEFDWWNTGPIDDDYILEDIRLLNEKLDKKSVQYKDIEAYVMIKNSENLYYANGLANINSETKLSQNNDFATHNYNERLKEVEKEILDIINSSLAIDDTLSGKPKEDIFDQSSYIKKILLTHDLLLDGKPLPINGKMANDFLTICFTHSLITKEAFLKERGTEILKKSEELKNVDFLNCYMQLLPSNSTALNVINKIAWLKYKDEHGAWSYLISSLIGKRLDTTELDQAILDFPQSSRIYLIKLQKAKLDNKDLKPYLVELIKKEFKRIDSGIGLGSSYNKGHNSNALKLYFELLKKGSAQKINNK